MTLTDSGTRQLATGIVCGVIGILAIGLRFWCKRTMRNGVHADDWWMLATLLVSWGAEAGVIWGESLRRFIIAALRRYVV